jgi:type II secretory pathway predicted ATPase ExeA
MMLNYKSFFAFTRDPFGQDIKIDELHKTPALDDSADRFLYAVNLRAACVLTGEVGAGKSTALRYASSKLHPSMYKLIFLVANPGSPLEILRLLAFALDLENSNSSAKLFKSIRASLLDTALLKQVPVLVIDEANLLRLDSLALLHTIAQFDMDSKPVMPIILAGQNNLLDKLSYHSSRPLASRVVGRTHLDGLKLDEMSHYLRHHLKIAGVTDGLFSDEAILAIHQNSGGLLRRANALARGSLVAAANEKLRVVAAEHVRIASTEII